MPADKLEAMPNVDEINRLTARGLDLTTAIKVKRGKADEDFEVARACEKCKVDKWCKGRKNIPTALTAVWDRNPEHFYLALDGKSPDSLASADFALICAEITEVNGKLTHIASRDKDPWHRFYKRKSCGIAYRWVHGNGVTPPLICAVQDQINIVGGMHRFHLAKHYETVRMPFLVRKTKLDEVRALLPSAAFEKSVVA